MTDPIQQIKPGMVFKRKVGANIYTYRVQSKDIRAGFWSVKVIDLNGLAVSGGAHPIEEREIQDALSKATPCRS